MVRARNVVDCLKVVFTHPANAGQRIRALGRVARGELVLRRGGTVFAALGDAQMRVVRHQSSQPLLWASPRDWGEMHFWRNVLVPGDLFVDVGANVGVYSVWAARAGAEVIAFEPNPTTRELLEDNLERNRISVDLRPVALGESPGSLVMTAVLGSGNHVLRQGSDADGPTVEVPVSTLDAELGDRPVRGLKMDIEGFEPFALAGARRLLGAHQIDVIQLEWNHEAESYRQGTSDLDQLLKEFGYDLATASDAGLLIPLQTRSLERSPRSELFAVSPSAQSIPWA